MPKVIRTRNLISAGEVEIPDQVLPVPMEIPADPEEGAEAPEAQAAPQPDPEQTRRAAEELFRSRLEQMQTQAEETSGKILRHAGEERERILQEARTEAEEIRRQAREEAYQAAVEEKRQRIENLLGATEGLLNQLAQQQRQTGYAAHGEIVGEFEEVDPHRHQRGAERHQQVGVQGLLPVRLHGGNASS